MTVLGLSWFTWTLLLVLLVVGFLIYYRLLFPPTVDSMHFPGMIFLYADFQCRYMDVGCCFERVAKDTVEVVSGLPCETDLLGFYFDDPTKLKDPQMGRVAIGIALTGSEMLYKGEELARRSSRYRLRTLPRSKSLHMQVPLRNMISYFLLGFYWRRIASFISTAVPPPTAPLCGIELYNMKRHTVDLYFPLEEGHSFQFSQFADPPLK